MSPTSNRPINPDQQQFSPYDIHTFTRISDSKWVKPIFSKFRITGDSQVRWSSVPANMTKARIILILTNHRLD